MPQMRVLGYQPTRPRLRLLSLPEGTVEPSPVRLDAAANALDRGFARDGWIAFVPNLGAGGPHLAVSTRHREGLSLLDVASRRQLEIAKPLPGPWGMFPSFSPDGSMLAIEVAEDPRPTTEEDAVARLWQPDGGGSHSST